MAPRGLISVVAHCDIKATALCADSPISRLHPLSTGSYDYLLTAADGGAVSDIPDETDSATDAERR